MVVKRNLLQRNQKNKTEKTKNTAFRVDETVSVLIPVLNERAVLPELLQFLTESCEPAPFEVVVCDSGSTDGTPDIVIESFPDVRLVRDSNVPRSRASTQNCGLAAARGSYAIFVHADTKPPSDFVKHVCDALADGNISLGAFTAVITDGFEVNQFITFHHYIKTWYGPLLVRPHLFLRGLRAFFGDQCIFGRTAQLLSVGGFDLVPIMEDSALCKKMVKFGPQLLVSAQCTTSDRRIKLYGTFKASLLHIVIGFGAELAVPLSWLKKYYPPQHVLEERRRLNDIWRSLKVPWAYEARFLWREIVDQRCYDHQRVKLPSGSIVIDVGANFGLCALWIDEYLVRSGTIHAIEANPALCQFCSRNAGLASHNSMIVHNVGISSQDGAMPFTVFPHCTGWSSFDADEAALKLHLWAYIRNRCVDALGDMWSQVLLFLLHFVYLVVYRWLVAGKRMETVQTLRLSSWMRKHGVEHIDLLKIDVEKHEWSVVHGIDADDWPKIENVVIEVEVHHGKIRSLLEKHGFEVQESTCTDMRGTPYVMMWAFRNSEDI